MAIQLKGNAFAQVVHIDHFSCSLEIIAGNAAEL
jgi:hypothetical protein